MIDIIIPAYNAHATLGRALCSIANQTNRESIVVYIVDDGSECGYDELVNSYSHLLNIKLIRIENSGPGNARQVGLDASSNEYIVFVDSDDTLHDPNSLLHLVNIMPGADMAEGRYIDMKPEGPQEMDPQYCYLHGKMFRRSIIDTYDIRFNTEKLTKGDIQEDNAYNQLYSLCCKTVNRTDEIIYEYQYNEQSLTRSDRDIAEDLHSFVKMMTWLCKEIRKRNIEKRETIAWDVCMMMYSCYFHYLLDPDRCEFVYTDMKEIKKMYKKYIGYLSNEDKIYIYKLFNYDLIPMITIDQFVDQIQ